MITFVWAESENGVIGDKGKIPWNLPSDMSFFKQVTWEGIVIMGRKTYESIPNPPLPGRINVVLTHQKDYQAKKEVKIVHSKSEIVDFLKDKKEDAHIIGGTALFELFKEEVQVLYRTVIHANIEGDTKMVPINWKEFQLTSCKEGLVDDRNIHSHDFKIYKRINKD